MLFTLGDLSRTMESNVSLHALCEKKTWEIHRATEVGSGM
jgi:hypothetical protein